MEPVTFAEKWAIGPENAASKRTAPWAERWEGEEEDATSGHD